MNLDVGTARRGAAIGGAAAGLVLLALGWLVLLGRCRDEAAHIGARYGDWIVDVADQPAALSVRTFDVPQFESLARIPQGRERAIVHTSDKDGHTYLVEDDTVQYRYQICEPSSSEDPAEASTNPGGSVGHGDDPQPAPIEEAREAAEGPAAPKVNVSDLEALLNLDLELDLGVEEGRPDDTSWLPGWLSLAGRLRPREAGSPERAER